MIGDVNSVLSLPVTTTSLPVAIFYGRMSGGTYKIPTSNMLHMVNSEYFSFVSDSSDSNYGKFLCKKAFTGTVYVMATSNLNKAGSGNSWTYVHFKLYVNGSNTNSITSNVTYTAQTYSSTSFTINTYTYLQGYCYMTNGAISGTGDFTMIITL